jgi:hypothetical protein
LNKDKNLTEVYTASGEMEALVIKGLLECNGIPCLLKSHAAPSVHVLTVDGLGEFKVMVPASIAEEAKKLIEGEEHSTTLQPDEESTPSNKDFRNS